MKSKYDKWLAREMKTWEEQKLVEKETIDKLKNYYEMKSENEQNKLGAVLSIFGSILIGLGILLVLAKNWGYFPRGQKIIITLLPFLLGSGLGMFVIKKELKGQLKEVAAIFSALGIFIAMMMHAQIYNILYEDWIIFLIIAILVLPLVYLYNSTLTLAMYLALITVAMFSADNIGLWAKVGIGIISIGISIPYVLKNYKKDLLSIETIWSNVFLAVAGFAVISSLAQSGVMLRELYITYFILLLTIDAFIYDEDITPLGMRPFAALGAIGLYITLFIFTFNDFWEYADTKEVVGQYIIVLGIFLLIVILLITYLFYKDHFSNKSLIVYILSAMLIVGFRITGLLEKDTYIALPIIFNLFFIILSIRILKQGITLKNIIKINIGLFMTAAIIVARFFDSNISFLLKGVIFIICGIGCILTNVYFINKHKKEERTHE